MPTVDRYGNVTESAPSVISPYHPANEGRHSHDEHGRYTFRQRNRNVNLKFTLGWELEANHAPDDRHVPKGIEHISDGSVNGHGAEFVVLPAVTRSPRYVLGLLKDLVHAPRLNTDESCGFHVHVSASNLASDAKKRQWAIATEHLAMQIEDAAFKAVPDSRKGNTYCKRITPLSNGQTFEAAKYSNPRRYHWLNTVEMFRPNGIRTIEVRLLGHTHRWKYLLAWNLFCLELTRRGWAMSLNPYEMGTHVNALNNMLTNIEKEIKPLAKRAEPIPQWVYNGLASFGITTDVWERPLSKLYEAECNLKGMPTRYYNNNQPEEEMPSNNEDECECGCGNEGRCDSQTHSDGDCDSNYCDYCHEDGNCGGTPDCERCRNNAHDDGEDCGRSRCSVCHPLPRVTARPVAPVVSDPLDAPRIHPSNVSVDMSGTMTGRVTTSGPLTAETMRAAVRHLRYSDSIQPIQEEVNRLHNVQVDAQAFFTVPMANVMHDAVMYGQGIGTIVYDEAAHMPDIEPTQETERRALTMLTGSENLASVDRMLTLDRCNSLMTPLERDASIERAEYVHLNRGGR